MLLGGWGTALKRAQHLRTWWLEHHESWSRRLVFVPPWLTVLGGVVAGGILGLSAGASREWTGAVVGLLRVVLGGVIAAVASFLLERERWKSQLTMATWADRVRAHQQAYNLWVQILQSGVYETDPSKRGNVFNAAYDWYQANCLYLTQEARDAFRTMYFAAHVHQSFLDAEFGSKDQARKIEENWEKIVSLGPVLIEGAGGHVSDTMLRELRHEHELQHKARQVGMQGGA